MLLQQMMAPFQRVVCHVYIIRAIAGCWFAVVCSEAALLPALQQCGQWCTRVTVLAVIEQPQGKHHALLRTGCSMYV